jgi:galactofuranose transport system substrate-binding protein
MDVNGHGVTLFFCRGEKWVKFCDRSRLPPAQRIPNQVRGAPENTTNCSPQNMKMTAIYKIYLALLAFPALFALTQPQASAADAAQKKLVVGFAQVGAESGWRTANTESIKSEAQKRGIDLRFSDAQQKEENQIKAIRSFIAQGVDVIAFSPVVETGFEPVLQEAKKAGIPVVLSDRAVKVSDPSLYVTFLGSDFVEEGRRAANAVAKLTGGKANIAELVGTVGSAPAIDRKKGFEEVLAKYPDMKIIMSQSGDFTRAKGKEVMEAFLKSPNAKEINVLFAHNDDMALGAIQAMEEAGIKPGQDIKIVSIDGVRGAFEAMKDGKLNVTVECNPLLGPQLFDLIEKVANKEEIPKRVVSQEGVYEQSQAAAELPKRQY